MFRRKSLHLRKRTEPLGQDALAKARIAQDHDRLGQRRDFALADGPRLVPVVFVDEESPDRVGHHAGHSGREKGAEVFIGRTGANGTEARPESAMTERCPGQECCTRKRGPRERSYTMSPV